MSPLFLDILRSAPAKFIRGMARPLAARLSVPVRVRLHSHLACYVDLRSAIGRGIFVRGAFDEKLGDYLLAHLSAGGVFIDIGANIGYFSLLATNKVGPSGQVHAFEIDPRSIKCLRLSQSKNRLHNLVIHEVALGEKAGLIQLVTTSEAGHTFVTHSSHGSLTCPLLPLDAWSEFFEQRGAQLIKLDVEGAELSVLRGARRILESCKPVVVCEAVESHLARFGHSIAELTSYMHSLGYSATPLDGSSDLNLVFRPDHPA